MSAPIEICIPGSNPGHGNRHVRWDLATLHGIDTDLDPWFRKFGNPGIAAVTLGRIGVAVFLADRAVPRNKLRQRRDIALVVPVPDMALAIQAQASAQRLLGFVTGDNWLIEFSSDTSSPESGETLPQVSEVALLSGGLDSFCGALIKGTTDRMFLSHSDASVIRWSQNQSAHLVLGANFARHVSVRVAAKYPFQKEASRRSRSILFVALAVALADAVGATFVEIPENGFTSLNPPLAHNRGGVLTTRSTHPMTFHLFADVLADLGLGVALRNPYEWHTKGELVKEAVEKVGAQTVADGASHTMSCAKSNLILKGKTFGRNCGLDYACIVRRAGIKAAGITDPTAYECHTPALAQDVAEARKQDVAAVRQALGTIPSGELLLARCGPFPPGYDYPRAVQLWQRGLDELRAINLP